jgi:hypothetical protein
VKFLVAGLAVAALGLYLIFKPGAPAKKGAGIGGAAKKSTNVQGFPVGQIAQSAASIGSSIFGGAGTHSPVDPSLKPPSQVGDPMKTAVVSLDDSKTSQNVPSASQVVTTLDEASSPSLDAAAVPPTEASVTMDDFSTD